MYSTPGSCFFSDYLHGNLKYIALLGLYGFLFIRKRKYRSSYALRLVMLYTISVLFTRVYTGGGAGINALFELLVPVLNTQMAISCDKENFLSRWIKLTTVMVAISIVFWGAFYAVPSLVNVYPTASYVTQSIGSVGYEHIYHGKGLFIYSWLEIHAKRNCGIFTEPGRYQIVLNMTLYILLFWQDKLDFKDSKQYRRVVAIILVGLVTCQSTTGYLGTIMILSVFFFMGRTNKKFRGIKGFMIGAVAFGIIVLLADYATRGNESILYTQFIYKLFGEEGSGLDVSSGTGQYRAGTAMLCLEIMAEYPLGIGFTRFDIMKAAYGDGLVAASLVRYPAVYGILPWVILLGLIFYPIILRQKPSVAMLYAALFVNTTLAQTYMIWPGFFMISMYLVAVPKKRQEEDFRQTVARSAPQEQSLLPKSSVNG